MLLHFILFNFCVATSIGFIFDDSKASATVGTPFTLTWHLDQGDDPDNLHLEERLTSQNSGDGRNIPFSFPNNGTRNGTVTFTFALSGNHLVEAFQGDIKSPIGTSDTIGVSSSDSGTNASSISVSATSSASTSAPITTTSTSSAPISSNSPSSSDGDSSTVSSFGTTGSLTTDGISTTTFTPSSTPSNSNSHKTKQMSTSIGAVIGVVIFLLLLALGVVLYYRVHRKRGHMLLPNPAIMLQYLQIRPSSRHGAIHKLRGRDVPVPTSVDGLRPTSINSGIVEFDVEEGVPGANLLGKGSELVMTRSLSLASDDDVPGPDPSISESLPEQASLQILAEEPTLHASTSTLPPRARNDEMAEEIIRLRTQIQQLIVDRVSVWDQNGEMDPPPAFCFCFATSIGFKFGDISTNAIVGTPFTLTWHLDQGEDPDKLHLQQRLKSQNSGEGKTLNFSFPTNGTRSGTVPVTFALSGEHLVQVFEDNPGSPNATSGTIVVSSPESGSRPSSITTSVALSTSVSILPTATSSVPSASTTSQDTTYEPSLASSSSQTTGTSLDAGGIPTSTVFTSNFRTATSATSSFNTIVTTSPRPNSSGTTTTYVSSVSVSPAIGSPSKTPLIVGATVGSFVFLLLLLAALVYTLHRRQWHRNKYPAIFHRDRMVRKRSNASFSPLTPTAKDPDTYTNFADVEKHASDSSTDKEDLAPSPQPQKDCLEYSLPAPLAPRSETPSPIPAHTDRQMEIYDVLVKKNTDLIRLKTELRRGGDVQEEIEGLKATITRLEEALVLPWALGYTDEMPYEVSRVLVEN
ncbi:uncharacterized protein ARMOST_18404 [Armillaria ostoyae]|uniref:GOLD domain-containing protein n=1 Tax=Armillaria ostoyae TaxID=47428 RepID=A0A284S1P5_ARMOS|nr:uncharacterized protein ARMOST_18404 [Armillaria ostoyae]